MSQPSSTAAAPRSRARVALIVTALVLLLLVVAVPFAWRAFMRPAATAPADVDDATVQLSENGLYRASFTVGAPAVPVNELHSWTLHVETPDGQPVDDAAIVVDGDMPEHGHGLPTRPQVTGTLGNGDYLVEGMKFQMGGAWVVHFDITANGQTDRVTFNLNLAL